jgi:hypothetical protein
MSEQKKSELEKAKELFEHHGITVTIDDSPEWDVIFPGPKGSAYLDRLIKQSEQQKPNG